MSGSKRPPNYIRVSWTLCKEGTKILLKSRESLYIELAMEILPLAFSLTYGCANCFNPVTNKLIALQMNTILSVISVVFFLVQRLIFEATEASFIQLGVSILPLTFTFNTVVGKQVEIVAYSTCFSAVLGLHSRSSSVPVRQKHARFFESSRNSDAALR